MTTKLSIHQRRDRVRQLIVTGIRLDKIAKVLEVSPRTIDNDIEAIQKEHSKVFTKKDIKAVLADYKEKNRIQIKTLWKIIESPGSSTKDKLSALNSLRLLDMQSFEMDLRLGIITPIKK